MRNLFIVCLVLLLPFVLHGQDTKSALEKNKSLFTDQLFSSIEKKTDQKKIDRIDNPLVKSVLTDMLSGNYSTEFRVQKYRSYLDPQQLAKKQKTSPYSQFENPTGIYFIGGEEAVLIVSDAKDVELRIMNFGADGGDSKYKLQAGINVITPTNSGNGYIQFFKQDEEKTEHVDIHIMGGKVNGYFDISRHKNADWKKLLDNAPSEILDIVGDRVQLAYAISSLKEHCPKDGEKLVNLYDSIISIQHTIMGLNQNDYRPENHIFGRVIWKGFMHADGIGAAFHNNTMKDVANPERIPQNLWGIAHEFGHVNQVRPWMKWVGTTEVTNNIYSVWSQYLFNPENPKLEREVLKDYDDRVAGGRITSYMESAFIHRQQWLTQAGPDRWDRERPRDWGGDHFVKLVPFWQLQLYYNVVGKGNSWYNPNFYGDIYIQAVKRDDLPKQDSEAQLNFIKKACDMSKTDLTDFFEYSGLLLPIDLWVDDYTCAQMTITEDDIVEVKRYASKYKKPETPVLHYLTANSIDAYKNKLAVKGEFDKGFDQKKGYIIVDHSIWENAVAYETYEGDKMVKIAFAGAGSNDNMSTLVRLPKGSTKVEAVAWDGTRILVYGKRI